MTDPDFARERLDEAVETLIAQDNAKFSFSPAALQRARTVLVEQGAHDRLIGELEGALRRSLVPHEKILEVGCGTATFLYSLLARGTDAFGIDNNRSRLGVADAKIDAFQLPGEWRSRIQLQDAAALSFETGYFDVVVGHQFIEHVANVATVLYELVRVTKRGGTIVLWAPDYRAPYEAHYEIPWPPFAPRQIAATWVEEFDKPAGGIDDFNYVTLPQVAVVLQSLRCDVVGAWLDKELIPDLGSWFDNTNLASLRASAQRIKAGLQQGLLPPQFCSPTSFGIVVSKR
jgi:ubiquinone/menaquinone biosynthesis C-methylase UbiE